MNEKPRYMRSKNIFTTRVRARDYIPWLNERARASGRSQTGRTGVDERGAISIGVDLFEVDDQFGRVMLGKRKHFGAKKGDDMVRDDLDGLVTKVRVIDTEVRVKPLDLVHYELARNETLEEEKTEKKKKSYYSSVDMRAPGTRLRGNVLLDFGTLLPFALEFRCGVPWKVFDAMQRCITADAG